MRIDFATLAFGYRVKSGGATPNWATSFGQGKEHKINNDPAIDEMLKALIYCSAPLEKISTKIGKGGRVVYGNATDSPIVLASVFSKVYINDTLIPDSKFVLLVTRDTSESHAGRLRLKYGPSNTFEDDGQTYSNEIFFEKVRQQFSLADNACWFVSEINVANQNELILKTIIVNPDGISEYETSAALHAAWDELDRPEVEERFSFDDALRRNFYGIHITHRNSAVANGEINIGWCKLGDLTEVESKDDIAALYDAAYPDAKPRSKAQGVSQIWTFRDGMSVGDFIVFGDGANAHIGIIDSDYYYEVDATTRSEDYVNNRKVRWLKSFAYGDLPKTFKSALSSARSVFSLNVYKSVILELLEKGVVDADDDENDKEDVEDKNMEEARPFIELNFNTNVACDFERNRIVFGAPGTGKSFQLEEDREKIVAAGGNYERVTFHPDYTYSSFVGCYKPVSEKGEIKYKYVPGPFMRVLVDALRSGIEDEQAKPFLLLIEEINRAKVAAVFGEVFQLLDRDSRGASDYEIHASEDVKKYLSDELKGSLDSFSRIKIPNNMFIWASMNSADQGVFPMDTAFKRRWSFEYKGIDENEDKVGGTIVLGKGDAAFEVNWNTLRKAINATLATKFGINEDKLMGPFFIGEDVFAFGEDGKIINPEKFIKVFKSKVIMYLYEDAAKQQKHKLFSGCDSTRYSSICDAFDEIGIEIFGADFKSTYNDLR